MATWDEPISLDPANTAAAGLNPIRLLFDTLVVQGADSTPHPGVAQSWTISDGGKAYTFRLKDNVRFHDGTPLDAHAVKFSLDRATSAQAKANFTISLVGIYQTTEVSDDLTARVVLTQPYAAAPRRACGGLSRHRVADRSGEVRQRLRPSPRGERTVPPSRVGPQEPCDP